VAMHVTPVKRAAPQHCTELPEHSNSALES
jgi:hypothetical protein